MNKSVASSRGPRTLSLVSKGARRSQSDTEVAVALVAGQTWALDETWYRLAPMVLAMAQRCLGSRSEAEDVTQEVFYRVFRKAHTLREPERLRSFVYSFAVRVLKSELRRRRIRSWLSFGVPESAHEMAIPSDVEGREVLGRFYGLLDRLSARARLVFVLRRIEGLTVEEVAERLAVSESTVKRSMERGTRQLERWVEADPKLKELLNREVGWQ
jgi:RNA polymerase sigma-70 factor, ECF subfamily